MAAPRVADDAGPLPAERVEDAACVADVFRHRVGPFHRRGREPSLLVPRDVVLLRQLVGEVAQVVEAEPRPSVQEQHRRPAAGASTREQRPVVVRRELGPRHGRPSSHAAGRDIAAWTFATVATVEQLAQAVMGHVSDILGRKGSEVLEIDGGATVFDAVTMMVEGNVGSLLVTEDGRLAGIVTERDYLRRVAIVGRDEKTTPVREIMSAPIVYTTPDSTIDECMAVMTERRIRHLPVLVESREGPRSKDVAGVVSIGDLVKFQSREQSAQIKFLEEYISG